MSPAQIAAAAAAVLVVALLARRWRRLEFERKAGLVLLALALAVYASGVLSALPDPKELIGDIARALGPWTYVLVGVMAFLETGAFVGLVAPGETVVIAGGVIAGQGEIDLLPLIGIVWVCAVLGDTTSFYIGRRLGRSFLERHGPRVKITHERLEQVEGYFDRHGGKTILIGRFIGLVRALAPFIAGASGLSYRRFVPFSIVGTGLWATVFCVLGYVFWRSFDQVAHIAGQAVFGFGVTVSVIVGAVVAWRRREEIRVWFRAHERHPLVRPLLVAARWLHRLVLHPVGKVLGPELRFLQDHLTVALVTAMAVAGGGAFFFVLLASTVYQSTALTPFDRELFDFGRHVRTDFGVDAAKVLTELGSFTVVTVLVAAAAVYLAVKSRPVEAVVLMLGFALIYVGVDIAKDVIDRPRPAGPLVDTSEAAFPSGHAAYATAWVAVAVAVTRHRALTIQVSFITGALVLAAAIGLTRVYLRAHYWSDVAGGWALGAAIYGGLATIALVVAEVRNNERDPATSPP